MWQVRMVDVSSVMNQCILHAQFYCTLGSLVMIGNIIESIGDPTPLVASTALITLSSGHCSIIIHCVKSLNYSSID